MSRIINSEVRSLMEAYNAPQELTEEQVWEEVEEWVNSLIEEGYDLSDCTWEEMYESYIFNPFDVVIGHLLDEGYADTEESALAIMANMSEEWIDSIVEQRAYMSVGDPPQKIRDYNNDNKTQSQIDREKRMKNFDNKRSSILQGV